MRAIQWAVASLAEKGIAQTSSIVLSVALDALFDWRYGTDTLRQVDTESLDTNSPNKAHAVLYQPTKARPLKTLLTMLALPSDAVFVDIGCGKGRVLLLAARHDFRKVVGIEFAKDLCAVARRNAERFGQHVDLRAEVEIIQADAATYRFRADETVLFMYNPFGPAVLEGVLANLRDSLAAAPRRIWLIYNTPKHHDVVMRSGLFATERLFVVSGYQFRVYTTNTI